MTLDFEVVFGYTNNDYDYVQGPWGTLDDESQAAVLGAYLYIITGGAVYRSSNGTTWTLCTASPAYGVRTGFRLLSFAGALWVFGGMGVTRKHDAWKSTDGATWTEETAAAAWSARFGHAVCVWDDQLWLCGGCTATNTCVNDLWRSSDGITWLQVTTSGIWTARADHILAPVTGGLIVLGGYGYSGATQVLRTDLSKSTDGTNWSAVTPTFTGQPEQVRVDTWAYQNASGFTAHARAAWAYNDGTLFVWGGNNNYATPTWWSCGVFETSDGESWTVHAESHDIPDTEGWWNRVLSRYGGAMAYFGGRLFLFSGVGADFPGDTYYTGQMEVWRTSTEVIIVPPEHMPAEHDWWEFACTPYGSLRDPSLTVARDFTRALVFDLALGKVYPAWGFPLSSTLNNSSPCAGPAQTPTGMFAGTADGYVAKLMGPDCYGLGTPCRRIAWALDAGCTDTILQVLLTEDEDFLPTYWVSGSAPEVRAGQLAGLPVVIEYADGSEAAGVIADNTNDTITLTGALTVTPAAGDVVLISPMTCGAWFAEARFQRPAAPRALYVDGYNNQSGPQLMTLDIFSAEGAGVAVEHTVAAANRDFLMEDTRIGDGRIALPGLARKALMYGLWFRPVGGGYLQIDGLRVRESVR